MCHPTNKNKTKTKKMRRENLIKYNEYAIAEVIEYIKLEDELRAINPTAWDEAIEDGEYPHYLTDEQLDMLDALYCAAHEIIYDLNELK